MSLNGKVAVVTGAGSGIGRACAVQLAKDGAAVAVWDLNGEGAQGTVDLITGNGGRAIAMVVDCASSAAITDGVAKVHADLGAVTVLVNNAGMANFTPVMDITEEHWDRMMAVNLKGPFLCIKAMLPDMRAAGWGRIINISSSSVQTGAPAMAHYVSSKGGVIGLTRALAIELAAENITVNHVPPGFVRTPMLEASPVDIDGYAATMPMKRAGEPEDIACAVSYFASEGAKYVTGQTIGVNGGRYLVF
ncbi:MAG TPA: SDR family NAD(P)-dependent oxidoreductase [Sphingobium sp.]|nr:SDR family NAD(P)-dependent oxidoreductase [Sphingobium sp.]